MPKKLKVQDNIEEKLEYIGLDLDKIPASIKKFEPLDFRIPKFYDENGVSAVIINTEKGKNLFKKLDKKLEYIETLLDKVKNDNKNLEMPTSRFNIRDKVFYGLRDKKFDIFIRDNKNIKEILKIYLKI